MAALLRSALSGHVARSEEHRWVRHRCAKNRSGRCGRTVRRPARGACRTDSASLTSRRWHSALHSKSILPLFLEALPLHLAWRGRSLFCLPTDLLLQLDLHSASAVLLLPLLRDGLSNRLCEDEGFHPADKAVLRCSNWSLARRFRRQRERGLPMFCPFVVLHWRQCCRRARSVAERCGGRRCGGKCSTTALPLTPSPLGHAETLISTL